MIYLDSSSTTKPLEEVTDSMKKAMNEEWGNPSSIHRLGHHAEKRIKECKKELGSVLGCEPDEILFTSCGTESTNTVLQGFWDAYPRAAHHIITSAGEHMATMETCRFLEKKGVDVSYLPLKKDGTIDLSRMPEMVSHQTALISLIHVNNETGAVLDLPELIRIRDKFCPEAKIHLDCVQSFGKTVSQIGKMGVDYVSLSAHKIHGPKGIGILYHKKGARISPLIHGGGQQHGLRSGTENLPAILGFSIAARETCGFLDKNHAKTTKLVITFLSLMASQGVNFVRISPEDASPYILNLAFPGIKAQTLLQTLESKNVFVSTQSACSSKKQAVSPVLIAMGIEKHIAESSIRISFSRFSTEDEIQEAARILAESIQLLLPKRKNETRQLQY